MFDFFIILTTHFFFLIIAPAHSQGWLEEVNAAETADLRKRQEAEAESSVTNLLVKQAEQLRKQNEREKKENEKKISNANIAKFVGAFMEQAATQEAEVYAQQDVPEHEFDVKPVLARQSSRDAKPSLKRQSSVEEPGLARQPSSEANNAPPKKKSKAVQEEEEEREEEFSDLEADDGMNARMAMFLQSSQSQDLW